MKEKLSSYIDCLLAGETGGEATNEKKWRLLRSAEEKYDSLLREGKSEGEAYSLTVSSISADSGYTGEEELRDPGSDFPPRADIPPQSDTERKSRLMLAIAVMLYICCVIPVILIQNVIGVCLMFIMIALATGIIIFRPSVKSYTPHGSGEHRYEGPVEKSVGGVVFAVFLAVYLYVSFKTGAWYITWVIFPIAAAASRLICALIDLGKGK